MEIEINGKKYKIDDNPRFGVMELLMKSPEDPKYIRLFLKEVLIPTPTPKEIFNFRKSDIENIMDIFNKSEQEDSLELKKKRGI
ncbi:MAG: hypothetical protein ACFFD2_15780 [Promethearchaeota archaeon]